MFIRRQKLCIFSAVVFLSHYTYPCKADEIQDNQYTIAFSDITVQTWNNDGKTNKFKNAMTTITNDYCSKNHDQCSLEFWNSTRVFSSSDIKISPGFPKPVSDNLQLQFHIELPNGIDIRKNSKTVLPKAAVEIIIESKESTLNSLIGATVMGSDGGTTSAPKVDNRMNLIMIPVSFGLLLVVAILAVCLQCCHKRKIEQAKAAERRQHASKQKPRDSNSQSPFVVTPTIPQATVKPQQRADNTKNPEETRVYFEDERAKQTEEKQVTSQSTSPEVQSPRRKKKSQKHKRRKEVRNGHANEGCEENGGQMLHKLEQEEKNVDEQEDRIKEVCGGDHERQLPIAKERKRKKKRHKRKVESPFSQEETDQDEDVGERTLESDDISSRLPPPRKLPPLKANSPINDNE